MAWGNNWDAINKMSKEEIVEKALTMLVKANPFPALTSFDLAKGERTVTTIIKDGELIYQSDNLIFVCDTCEAIFDPGITGFQALVDAARQAKWKITFHVLKDGYAMCCPTCQT